MLAARRDLESFAVGPGASLLTLDQPVSREGGGAACDKRTGNTRSHSCTPESGVSKAASALGCTTAAGTWGGRDWEDAFSDWPGCPDSSLSPSSAPGVGQAGPSVLLPRERDPSTNVSGLSSPPGP